MGLRLNGESKTHGRIESLRVAEGSFRQQVGNCRCQEGGGVDDARDPDTDRSFPGGVHQLRGCVSYGLLRGRGNSKSRRRKLHVDVCRGLGGVSHSPHNCSGCHDSLGTQHPLSRGSRTQTETTGKLESSSSRLTAPFQQHDGSVVHSPRAFRGAIRSGEEFLQDVLQRKVRSFLEGLCNSRQSELTVPLVVIRECLL